jgi:hypothetical protein
VPDLIDLYHRRVGDLRSTLADPETTAAGREALRACFVAVAITPAPGPHGTVLVDLAGCSEPSLKGSRTASGTMARIVW